MVCPASVDLKPDGHHQETQSCLTKTEEAEKQEPDRVSPNCHMSENKRNMQKYVTGALTSHFVSGIM